MLFKTIPEIKQYISVNATSIFDSIAPYIRMAEMKYLVPAIGKDEYDDLNTAYNGTDPLTDAQEALLPYAQRMVAYLAYSLYLPMGQVQVGESGIQIVSSENKKTAWQWQVDQLDESLRELGFNAVEEMLAFMEANKEDYPLWTASTAFTENNELFVSSAIEFTSYYNINNSRRLYNAMRFIIKKVETFKIKPLLGAAYFAALKASIIAGAVSDDDQLVLDFIKNIVCYLTLADLPSLLSVKVGEDSIVSLETSKTLTTKLKITATDTRLAVLQQTCQEDGNTFLEDLKQFLFTNKDNYPLYVSGGAYVDPSLINDNPYQNGKHSNIFFA